MESTLSYALLAFGSLFAVLNPFATVPPFIAMTQDNSEAERKVMARNACTIAAAVLIVFTVFGIRVLSFFGISVPAFQIAGGLVLVRVAFSLLQGIKEARMESDEKFEGIKKDDISVTPLGFPILCGPATITAAILLASQSSRWYHLIILILIICLIYAVISWLLHLAATHSQKLGKTGILISSRMMGLILLAIAVQFIVDGIRESNLFIT
ncbi:MAG: NAAT family transporter [Pseudohongiellaceae bacterium]